MSFVKQSEALDAQGNLKAGYKKTKNDRFLRVSKDVLRDPNNKQVKSAPIVRGGYYVKRPVRGAYS